MTDPSLLMNSEQPVNGMTFPMPSASMAFTNGQDMQGTALPATNPYGYPMMPVGGPGDMPGPHLLPNMQQIGQAGDSSSWITGGTANSGPPMMMPPHPQQSMPPFMMGNRPPFQSPPSMPMPPNMPGAPPGPGPHLPPNASMGMRQFPGFPSWPNGPPAPDQNWPQASLGASSPGLKPSAGLSLPGLDGSNASPLAIADMSSQPLPELGDVNLPDGKPRPLDGQESINGDMPSTPGGASQQHGMGNFNPSMMTSSTQATGHSTPGAADLPGSKIIASGRSLLGQDGMMNSSAGAMIPVFAPPSTVALTTQHSATMPMHPGTPRHAMAGGIQHAAPSPMVQPGMYNNHGFTPRMPVDGMHAAAASAASPFTSGVGSAGPPPPTTPPSKPTSNAVAAQSVSTPEAQTTTVGTSRCPKNISEVLQPLYKLGDEPERKVMLDKLVELSRETGVPTLYVPTLSSDHTHVDLYRLYEVVMELGGLCQVVKKKVWRKVIEGLGMTSPSNVSSLASTLRTHYQKLLLHLECKERGKVVSEELDNVERLRRTRSCQRHRNTSSPVSRRSGSPEPATDPAHPPVSTTPTTTEASPSQQTTSTVTKAPVSDSAHAVTTTPSAQADGGMAAHSMGSMQPPPPPQPSAGMPPHPAQVPGVPHAWGQQPVMQPPGFPPQQFTPRVEPMMPGMPPFSQTDNGTPMAPGGMFPDPPMAMPTENYMNFNQNQQALSHPGVPPQMPDASYADATRMAQYKSMQQQQQWKQQQLLQRQQQMMQETPQSTTSVSGTVVSSQPAGGSGNGQPSRVSGSASSEVFTSTTATAAATPSSPGPVFAPKPSHSQMPSSSSATAASPNAVFSRLLAGGSVDAAIASLTAHASKSTAGQVHTPATDGSTQDPGASGVACVENAAPRSVKRKRLFASHLAQRFGNLPNLWRLHMCLKAGLLPESTQALDILSILVSDEHTLCLFQLPQQPTVLETLLAHLASSLQKVFGGFADIPVICDGDAKRRTYPEDASDKDVKKAIDEEYESHLAAPVPMEVDGEELPPVDGEEEAAPMAIDEEVDNLPDGIRHIFTHLTGDLSTPAACYPARSAPATPDCSTLCNGVDHNADAVSTGDTEQFCVPWLRHGTAVESEPSSLACRSSSDRLLAQRALCVSNLVRSLSFLAANERHMSHHFGLMTIIARVESLYQDRSGSAGDASDVKLSASWWWPWLEVVRADLMVTLVNLSGQVDLSYLPSKLASDLLHALCHWCVSTSSSARDPLPVASACPGLSLQRLSLEALSKISIGLGNVNCMLALLSETSWHCLCGRLVQWLLEKRHSVQYELSLVLLCSLVSNDAVSRHVCEYHHCVVTLMMQLLSETENHLCSISRGVVAPDHHSLASVDLLRRAANILLMLSKQRCNQHHFAHYQSHLLILAASPYLYIGIPAILVDLLYQIGLE